jgi:plastocyanin
MPPAQPPVPRPLIAAVIALAAALFAGCSRDDRVRLPDPVVRVTLNEYAITPQDLSVPSGRVELVARNAGRLTHNLRVEVPSKDAGEQGRPLGGTPTAHPGQTVRATITLKPGTYRLRCSLANHDDLGMYGSLFVRKRRGVATAAR